MLKLKKISNLLFIECSRSPFSIFNTNNEQASPYLYLANSKHVYSL